MLLKSKMEKLQEWVFVDLENIHNPSSLLHEGITMLFVFVGAMQPRIETEFIKKCEELKLKPRWVFIDGVGRNNADSHLMYYLGRCDMLAGPAIEFVIISRDTDYDGLIQHIRTTGRQCRRIATVREEFRPSPAPIPMAAPRPQEDLAYVTNGEAILALEDPMVETEVFVERIIERLKKNSIRHRPTKVGKLLNFIGTMHPRGLTAQDYLQELVNRGIVKVDEQNSLTYSF